MSEQTNKLRVAGKDTAPAVAGPDFDAAVALAAEEATKQAVTAMRAEMRAELQAMLTGQKPESAGNDSNMPVRELLQQLAMSIAEISDQGTDRKREDPKVLAARESARIRMLDKIMDMREAAQQAAQEAVADGANDGGRAARLLHEPKYRLKAPCYINEQKLSPFKRVNNKTVPQDIFYTGIPNDVMLPLNETARGIYAEYRAWVGQVSEKDRPQDPRGYYLTPAGLTVQGDAPAYLRPDPSLFEFSEDLDLGNPNDPNDPRATRPRILGSIHAPAEQSLGGILPEDRLH